MKQILLCLILILSNNAFAEKITILIHSAPGGLSHRYALELQPIISKVTGVDVNIDIKPGGDGYIAARYLAENNSSDIVLLLGTPRSWPELSPLVDLTTDVITVAYMGYVPGVVVTVPGKFTTMRDALSTPNISYGISAASPSITLMQNLIRDYGSHGGVDVRYKSGLAALADVLGGHIDLGITTPDVIVPYVASRKLIPLAVLGEQRSAILPGIKTLYEQGYATAFEDRYYNNFFIWCNKRADPVVVSKITSALNVYMDSKESTMLKTKLDISYTPKDAKKYLKAVVE
jgi:tripartite-type tricarboxylate transporter receptor subunit TctC